MTTATTLESTLEAIEDVEGWMSDEQARTLWDAAAALGVGDKIVEIGSFRGRSAVVLATAAPAGVSINTIDPHAGGDRGPREIEEDAARGADDHELFLANLERCGVADRIDHIRKMSADAHDDVDGEIALLYIDGAHRYAPAQADIESWGSRVQMDGRMLIHDSFNSIGVMGAQLVSLFVGKRFEYLGRTGSLAAYRRRDLGLAGRVKNLIRQMVEIPYFLWSLLIKLLIAVGLGRFTRYIGWREETWPF